MKMKKLARCTWFLLWLGLLWRSTAEQEEEAASECAAERPTPPPGLYTPHTKPFAPIPEHARRTVCVCPHTEHPVLRAFKAKGRNVVELPLANDQTDPKLKYLDCVLNETAVLTWTKSRPVDYWYAKPWQRHNWLPMQMFMTHKGHFQRAFLDLERRTGRKQPFIPDTYLLPADRDLLLERLRPSTPDHPDIGGGDDEPWVIKLSATDNGVGIAIFGPNSEGIRFLNKTLLEHENSDDYMQPIREALVLKQQDNDLRDPAAIERARQRSLSQNDDIVVQRYICHEMDYKGRKFDLRLYFLVASVDPLIVYYHDGALRVSLSEYNDKVFDSTTDHLTNLGRNDAMDNCTVALPDWEKDLLAHVAQDPSRFPPDVAADPLGHVRNQAKAALAELILASRDVAFSGLDGERTYQQNYFAILGGDFIVDRDLHVWMTEAQSSPGYGHETKVRRSLYEQFIPSAIEIVTQVMEKQSAGLPAFPIENTGDYQLIYTDDYQFTHDFQHKKQQRGPC